MDARDHQRQLWLVRESDRRETGTTAHGTYRRRANFDEARARLLLYPPSRVVDNVVPIRPLPDPPDAA